MERLGALEANMDELRGRYEYIKARGEETAGVEASLRALVPQFVAVRDEIAALAEEPDVASGHAFIVFNLENL